MLHSTPEWEAFERDEIRRQPKGYAQGVELFRSLLRTAVQRGKLPSVDPLEGIEHDVELRRHLDEFELRSNAEPPGSTPR